MNAGKIDQRGVWIAVAAYVAWGLMPLYWHLLKVVPAMQIIAHRVLWSAVLVCGWLAFKNGRGWLHETLALPRAASMLALTGVLIAFNWGLYIWAVNAGGGIGPHPKMETLSAGGARRFHVRCVRGASAPSATGPIHRLTNAVAGTVTSHAVVIVAT